MSAQLIKVRLERFEAGKPFAREVFLSMPLNGKMIRLVVTGDALSESLLLRLRSRKIEGLFVQPLHNDDRHPESCILYLEEPATKATSAPLALPTPAAEASSFYQAEPSATSIDPSDESSLPANLISGETGVSQPESSLVGSSDSVEDEKIFTGPDAESEAEAVVTGQLDAPLEEIAIAGTPIGPEEANRLAVLNDLLEEAVRVVTQAAESEPSAELTALASDLELSSNTFKAACASGESDAIVNAADALTEALQTFKNAAGNEQSQSVAPMKELVDAVAQQFSKAASDGILEHRFSADLLSQQSSDSVSLSGRIRDETQSFTKDQTTSANFSQGNLRAAVYKELPATAGRLAAYLAHSLGYVSLSYLSDLSLGVLLHFTRAEGKEITAAGLPMLIRAILGKEHSVTDATIEDALEIVTVLEAYFRNPECDRSQRDFSPKIFQDTINELRANPEPLNGWNEVRWEQFVAKGPSMSAHSLCSKAAARAIKTSREMAN